MRQGRGSETTEAIFTYRQKSLFVQRCLQRAIIQLVCSSVCLCVCVAFVVLTDCVSCTRPISTNPGSMGADEYGLTRRMCFVARRLEVGAVCLLYTSDAADE